jgi:hypothetical protein
MEKGDLVRTERGFFAKVNWVREYEQADGEKYNLVGCSYVERTFPPLACMTFKEGELTLVKTKEKEFFSSIFKMIDEEERRYEIARERAVRKTMPTQEQKVIKRNCNLDSIFKELSASEIEALKEVIRAKGGKI